MIDLIEEDHEEIDGGDHEEAIEIENKSTHVDDQEH